MTTEQGVVWERKLKVVKPSEMIVADIPIRSIGAATSLEFAIVPAPETAPGDELAEEEA